LWHCSGNIERAVCSIADQVCSEVVKLMLENVSQQIRDCYERAEECARKAAAQTDPGLKQDFLDMERRGLTLAWSYELSDRLGDFSKEAHRKPSAPPAKPSE
jgi:hypothetical protein